MVEKVIMLLKEKSLQIPSFLFMHYRKLNMTERELLMVIALWNLSDNQFNPKVLSDMLGYSIQEVLELVTSLNEKGLLEIKVIKKQNQREEMIQLDHCYQKLAFLIMEEGTEVKEVPKENLFTTFEQEFGRTLSPIEYELINGWKDADYQDELILLALKEAVYNGVSSLRYIDKILYEWKKKGIKTQKDVEEEQKRFKSKKIETTNTEVFEYDWLNDNDE